MNQQPRKKKKKLTESTPPNKQIR